MALGDGAIEFIERKKAEMYGLLQEWAGTMEGYAKEHAAWRDRTGHARQSIHSDVERNGNKFILYLSHGMEYSGYLESGTPPHIIRPNRKKALYWQGAKHPVKLVHHPGTKSYAIIGPTIDTHIGRIKKSVLDLWSE
ncbi:hypothetical protein D2962_09465 [Biomaibacter acetigenes]|uniref:HK97 gp10 family phage protein n=1 Tax=Biomaibacter acetigenes TaxID=2316383 RepID=A0A3G2R7L5_9FIRM|nr:HK97 gp10 family phage protein [Biomaibacter acetigenes]AYO30807.1 hypothetical protein D2962_09465 [Biomaibacter acetigenes]